MHTIRIILPGLIFLGAKLSAIGLPTSEVALVGRLGRGPVDLAVKVDAAAFKRIFRSENPGAYPAEVQALQFFRNGGDVLSVVRVAPGEPLSSALKGSLSLPRFRGLGALIPLGNPSLLVCPGLTSLTGPEMAACLAQIEILGTRRPLFTLLDPPPVVTTAPEMLAWRNLNLPADQSHTALYFPRLLVDPASWSGGASMERLTIGASGTIAAVIQKNDISRGIWKAPAGPSATIISEGLTVNLDTVELDNLNQSGINSIRDLPTFGQVVWGSRSLDTLSDQRYLPVARTRRWIERSLQRELSDAALQPNNNTLRSTLELRAEAFLDFLFRQGAFAGTSPRDAYFAKCDSETTTPADIAAHRVNLIIGASYLRSAEFMIDEITLGTQNESKPHPGVPLLVPHPVEGIMYLRFPTFPGFTHRLESTGNLQNGSWSGASEIPGDGSWVTLDYRLGSPKSFFRVSTSRGW